MALAAVAVLGVAACSTGGKTSQKAPGSSTKTRPALKIGFFASLTGPDASLGVNIEDGEKLAVAEYNASNPEIPVSLDPFNSRSEASLANDGATELIDDHDVAVIGPDLTAVSVIANPIFEVAQIPNISVSATDPSLAKHGWKFFHRVVADDTAQGRADSDYLVKTLALKAIAVIHDNSSYGSGLAASVADEARADGAAVDVTDQLDPKGADYVSTVNKIMAVNPSGVFYGGYYDAAGRLINQLRAAGYKGVFMSGEGSDDNGFITDSGGTVGETGSPAEGAYLSCSCADETQNPAAASFVTAYKSMFGSGPATYSAEAYDATNFILAAIKFGATTPVAVNDYLASKSYSGVTKMVRFLPDGNIAGGTIYVYRVESGKITEVGTAS